MRQVLTTFINALMGAKAEAVCGAEHGQVCADRVNSRNGYRHRNFDTRTGTLDVAIPRPRTGSYFPDWLLKRRRRAEAALTSVVATCYLLPAGRFHPADGETGRVFGHHPPLQVASVGDGPVSHSTRLPKP